MAKNKKKQDSPKQNKQQGRNSKNFKVQQDVKKFAKITLKKFKKQNDFYDNKKELREAYYASLLDALPDVIIFCVRYGHIESNKTYKEEIYSKLVDPKFIKYLKKAIKSGDNDIKNIEQLPIMIADICNERKKYIERMKKEIAQRSIEGQDVPAEAVNIEDEIDLSDLVELSEIILKKKIKKLTKSGINADVALDILSQLPTPALLNHTLIQG